MVIPYKSLYAALRGPTIALWFIRSLVHTLTLSRAHPLGVIGNNALKKDLVSETKVLFISSRLYTGPHACTLNACGHAHEYMKSKLLNCY